MSEQHKFVGFDSKCEDCGIYYASDYIEFHKKHRCLKKPYNLENHPDFQQQLKKRKAEKSTQLLNLPAPKNHSLPTQQYQDIVSHALKGIRKKKQQLQPCPHCNTNVKQISLKKHISICPALKLKANLQKNLKNKGFSEKLNPRKKDVGEKLTDCPHCNLKLKTKNLQKHIFTFHSSISSKPQNAENIAPNVVCSKCGAFYSALAAKCPQCNDNRIRIKTLSPINKLYKCQQCKRPTMYAASACQFCGDK